MHHCGVDGLEWLIRSVCSGPVSGRYQYDDNYMSALFTNSTHALTFETEQSIKAKPTLSGVFCFPCRFAVASGVLPLEEDLGQLLVLGLLLDPDPKRRSPRAPSLDLELNLDLDVGSRAGCVLLLPQVFWTGLTRPFLLYVTSIQPSASPSASPLIGSLTSSPESLLGVSPTSASSMPISELCALKSKFLKLDFGISVYDIDADMEDKSCATVQYRGRYERLKLLKRILDFMKRYTAASVETVHVGGDHVKLAESSLEDDGVTRPATTEWHVLGRGSGQLRRSDTCSDVEVVPGAALPSTLLKWNRAQRSSQRLAAAALATDFFR
ncbi:hypothetical protein MRX96_039715 [Rhipicephalus microplus]